MNIKFHEIENLKYIAQVYSYDSEMNKISIEDKKYMQQENIYKRKTYRVKIFR